MNISSYTVILVGIMLYLQDQGEDTPVAFVHQQTVHDSHSCRCPAGSQTFLHTDGHDIMASMIRTEYLIHADFNYKIALNLLCIDIVYSYKYTFKRTPQLPSFISRESTTTRLTAVQLDLGHFCTVTRVITYDILYTSVELPLAAS